MKADIDMVNGMRMVTMHVHLKRDNEMRLRVWLGCKLMTFAAWVMNCNIALTQEGDE